MQAEFRPPRRRNRVYEDYKAPLPLIRNRQDRKHYRGELVHQQVLVCHPDHIQSIYSQVRTSRTRSVEPSMNQQMRAQNQVQIQ